MFVGWERHTLDGGVVVLLGAGRVDDIHLRELVVEGWVREHAAGAGLVVAEDGDGEACGMLLVCEAWRRACWRPRLLAPVPPAPGEYHGDRFGG
jgi:hypothetical protein